MAKLKLFRQSGYSLIELLLYVAIVGSLLITISYFFANSVDARIKNQAITEVNEQGAFAMDYIMQTIRNATSITAPTAGNTSNTALTLVVPTGSLSPTVFNLTGGTTLQVQEGSSPTVSNSLTNSKVQVTNLSFKNLTRSGTPGTVQVSFQLSRVNPSNKNEYDYQRTFTASAEVGW